MRIEETVDETLGYLSLTLLFVITEEVRRKDHFATRDRSYSSSSSFIITRFAPLVSSSFIRTNWNLSRQHRLALFIYGVWRPLLRQIKMIRQRPTLILFIMLQLWYPKRSYQKFWLLFCRLLLLWCWSIPWWTILRSLKNTISRLINSFGMQSISISVESNFAIPTILNLMTLVFSAGKFSAHNVRLPVFDG